MAEIARVFRVGQNRTYYFRAAKLEVAPNKIAQKRRGEGCLGIISFARCDRHNAVTLFVRSITGSFDSAKFAIPNNNASSRMSRLDQAIHDGVDDVAMRREKFAACRGDLDANLVVRRNQRRPRFGKIGLLCYGENKSIHHRAHASPVGMVVIDRRRITRDVNDRWRSCRARALRERGSAKKKRERKSNQHDNQRTV